MREWPDVMGRMRRECDLALDPAGLTLEYADGNEFYADVLRMLDVLGPLEAVAEAAARVRKCDAPAIVTDPRAHQDLLNAMEAMYDALTALEAARKEQP